VADRYEQCPRCGAWRKAGIELSTHIAVCDRVRCPLCGHGVNPKFEHVCPGTLWLPVRRVNGVWEVRTDA